MWTSKGRALAISAAITTLTLAAVAGTLLNVHNARAAGFSVTDCTSETGPGTIG
jgi:hypothetical protein